MWRDWEALPEFMKTPEVRPYWEELNKKKGQIALKRAFDLEAALLLLVPLSIPMAVIAIAIKKDSEGSVFYRQERVTAYGKRFRIHKFRTMVNNADKIGTAVTVGNDSRITKVGRHLRDLRLDERVIIGQTTEGLVNKGFREVSPIHFSKGRNLISQYYNDFHAGGEGLLVA